MVIDGEVAFVGSANMDSRSLILNYETNLAVFDSTFVERLRLVMQDDFEQAEEMIYAQWRLRSKTRRLIENFFNLFHLIA